MHYKYKDKCFSGLLLPSLFIRLYCSFPFMMWTTCTGRHTKHFRRRRVGSVWSRKIKGACVCLSPSRSLFFAVCLGLSDHLTWPAQDGFWCWGLFVGVWVNTLFIYMGWSTEVSNQFCVCATWVSKREMPWPGWVLWHYWLGYKRLKGTGGQMLV